MYAIRFSTLFWLLFTLMVLFKFLWLFRYVQDTIDGLIDAFRVRKNIHLQE